MKCVATSYLPSLNQEPENLDKPVYKNLLLPTRSLQRYLLNELPRRNVDITTLGKQTIPLMAGLIQAAADDFGLYKGTSLDDECYSTKLGSVYLLPDDRWDVIEQCRLMINQAVYDYVDVTYFEHPWYYRLPTYHHLLFSFDKRDVTCESPDLKSPEVVDIPSPFNTW